MFKKTTIAAIAVLLAACSTRPEHSKLQFARTQYERQIKTAIVIQSYLNNPQTSIAQRVWWSREAKVTERDTNVDACLHNAQLYNRLAPTFTNLNKSWLPAKLEESRCLPVCDGDSVLDKTCYVQKSKG